MRISGKCSSVDCVCLLFHNDTCKNEASFCSLSAPPIMVFLHRPQSGSQSARPWGDPTGSRSSRGPEWSATRSAVISRVETGERQRLGPSKSARSIGNALSIYAKLRNNCDVIKYHCGCYQTLIHCCRTECTLPGKRIWTAIKNTA